MPLKMVLLEIHGCAECERQRAVWEEVRREGAGQARFIDIDIRGNPDAANYYDAREHPTIVLEREGRELKRWTGVTSKAQILAALKQQAQDAERQRALEVSAVPASAVAAGRQPGTVQPMTEEVVPPPGGPVPSPGEPPGPPPAP